MISRDACRDLQRALALEWLLTDGRGGCACGTVSGTSTRRHHVLFAVASGPSLSRAALLARTEEEVEIGGQRVPISTNLYPGAVHPRGFERIVSFRTRPLPSWRFEVPGGEVERTLCLDRDTGALVVRWRLLDARDAVLHVRPVLAFRDHDALGGRAPRCTVEGMGARFSHDGFPDLHVWTDPPVVLSGASWWYERNEYPSDREPGSTESLHSPGEISLDLRRGTPVYLVASDRLLPGFDERRAFEKERRRRLHAGHGPPDGLRHALALAADDFVVEAPDGLPSIVGGFPWIGVRARDSLVALPGLLLARGLVREAAELLRAVAARIVERADPHLRSVTPALEPDSIPWFAVRTAETLPLVEDAAVARDLFRALLVVFEQCERGCIPGLRVGNGLVCQTTKVGGETRMDEREGGASVNPQVGCTVELSALWHRALAGAAVALHKRGWMASHYLEALAARTRRAFVDAFVTTERHGILDLVGDAACRPYRLLALAGPHPVVEPSSELAARVLDRVRASLVTPRGLRSLDPADPRYRGRGGASAREVAESAQLGSAWPWLLGPYADVVRNVVGDAWAEDVGPLVEGFAQHLEEACLGQVSERFDGDAPHAPSGAPAHAMAVGELLRLATALSG